MQYCMYLRKSRTDLEAEAHKEGDTLLRHEVLLKDLAQRQSITITKIYKEIVSGETIAARPVMQKLLQEVEQGIWNGVLVMEIERLARGDTIDQGMVAQAFKYSETKIITPLKIYDPSNEYDEEYFEFGLFMSRREFKTINRRIQRGRIASVNEGKFISSTPPYGYFKQKLTNEKGYTLLPHPDDSKVVKLIYEWYTTGYQHSNGTVERLGCLKIAGLLNSMRYKPPKAKAWSKSTILDILKNPVYIGYIRWQYRKEITSIVDNQPKKYRSYTGDCLLVKGLHKSIISEEVYQKAQTYFKNKSLPPIPGNRAITNPLLGILYCGKCGRHLTRLSKNNKAPYDLIKCMNPNCDNISSPLSLVEEQILKGLEQWVKNYTFNPPCLSDILSPLSSIIESKEDYIKDIISQIQRKEKSFEKICEYLEEGVYSREEFQRRKLLILKSIEELNYTYMFLSDELKQLNLQKERNITIPAIKSLSSLYYSLTTPSKNEFLKNLLEKVEYQKDHRNRKGDALRCNFILNIYPKIINIP